jgi:xanthine/CO dehydrogenase XdhC/CoxF family maturation factor
MDFISKPINTSQATVNKLKTSKELQRLGKSRFKDESALLSNNTIDDSSALQTFAVTALDTALLDMSRSQQKCENVNYGHKLLDKLDTVKVALLTGHISQQDLLTLEQILANKRQYVTDVKLQDILQEIETRVAVELAKLGF